MIILLHTPMITDWISSIAAAIGIPFVMWSFVKLIIKDKGKQAQLNSLRDMASNQNEINIQLKEQVAQLTKHAAEFQYQSTLMFDSNQLLEKQVQILNDFFIERKISETAKLDLAKQKRLLQIKPHFIYSGGGSNPQQFELVLKNKGGTANNVSIEKTNAEFVTINDINPNTIVDSGQLLSIIGYPNTDKTYWNGNLVNFELNLRYKDMDGNEYYQKVRRQDQRYFIDNPALK
ncbi:hypothetical protein FW778_17165 [Ginsengibacter hankyongi]|uniref:Uncharacterized protein n=1 Tax=Ginsengibacter hankyongi TaxID=2607284 RepID=A0A5J5ID29_9BACT|nr:hypothetical protein [Ginsengibacter hankyongi]KAA9037159.1 hypothetical protein FW778_17165 [Ginsengibacter hankyongi]